MVSRFWISVLLVFLVTKPYYVQTNDRVPLILLGVDGFAYDLYTKYGNKSSGDTNVFPIQTVFPSKTFPNFMSIATGLYPTQHGIISNKFLNQDNGEIFEYEDEQHADFTWYKGEPIWITAKKAGLRVYTDMWVGSAASYDGIQPDIFSVYDDKKNFTQKVEDLVENMDSSDEIRCDFYVIYTNQPDYSLHRTDITDPVKTQKIITSSEEQIALLKSSLGERKYNLVIVSDHGMSFYKRKYELSNPIRSKALKYYGGPFAMWYSKDDSSVKSNAKDLNEYLQNNGLEGAVAVEVAALPKRFQMCGLEKEGRPDIVLLMEDEVAMGVYNQYSGHGYDNTFSSMFGHVRVSGPAFKSVPDMLQSDVIMNTELYNLFSSLLDIKPASNTGDLDTFDFILSNPPNRTEWETDYVQQPPPCGAARRSYPLLAFLFVALLSFYPY